MDRRGRRARLQPDWEPFEIVVEHDGFVLTLLEAPDGSVYTLADATTGDGVNWLAVDLEAPDPEFWPVGAAVSNGSVLYQSADGWVLEPLPS